MEENLNIEIQISFEKGAVEKIRVTPLGANLYRLEETPLSGEANYHDVIEAIPGEDGILEFRLVPQPSPLRRYDYILSKELIEAEQLKDLLDRLMVEGGICERVMGGILYLYLPPGSKIDLASEIHQIAEELSGS